MAARSARNSHVADAWREKTNGNGRAILLEIKDGGQREIGGRLARILAPGASNLQCTWRVKSGRVGSRLLGNDGREPWGYVGNAWVQSAILGDDCNRKLRVHFFSVERLEKWRFELDFLLSIVFSPHL